MLAAVRRQLSVVENDHVARMKEYEVMTRAVLSDGLVHPLERDMLNDFAQKHGLSEGEHAQVVKDLGWSMQEFDRGVKHDLQLPGVTRHNTPYPPAGAGGANGVAKSGKIEKAVSRTF